MADRTRGRRGLDLPAFADKGSAEYKQGARAESQMNYDSACAHYKQATTLSPNNPQYFSAYARVRFEASMRHVHTGQLLLNTGALTDALAEFQHASELDTSSFIAQQEMRRTADMLRKQERQRSLPPARRPPGSCPKAWASRSNCTRSRMPPSACTCRRRART